MKEIFKILFNRWIILIFGLLAVSLLIWFTGPSIAFREYYPLESATSRIILIVIILVFYAGKLFLGFLRKKQLNFNFIENLLKAKTETQSSKNANTDLTNTLTERFENAINQLKQANKISSPRKISLLSIFTPKQYLYELPWYIVIGNSGSGKTVAIVNSGLQFPLADSFGANAIKGIGGTRNCDWWFTNEAVLIDTAGRYTVQQSNQEVDHAEWTEFLSLLKKYRTRRPINGAIITISIPDLLKETTEKREAHAIDIRKRIQELHSELNIQFPIYVMVTKLDLLSGFIEFFNEFGKELRSQVWGMSFQLNDKQGYSPLSEFNDKFSALEQKLNDRLIDFLHEERDLEKRALLYTFPQQFSSIKEVLYDFLNLVFSPTRYEQQPILRGIYFTSGTQEGNPIDRLIGNVARALHIDRPMLPQNKTTGKSFFITRLLNDIIFAESELAGSNQRWERKQVVLQWIALSIALLLTLSMAAAWTLSYTSNKKFLAEVNNNIELTSEQIENLPILQQIHIVNLLSSLESVQNLPKTSYTLESDIPLSMKFGLFQGSKIESAAHSTYKELLQNAFLPQIVFRIEYLLTTTSPQHLEFLYESLKAYLMLFDKKHFDKEALQAFIEMDWEANFSHELTNQQLIALKKHLANLLEIEQYSSPIRFNNELVTKVRNLVERIPIEERIYNRLKKLGTRSNLSEFTIASAAGPSASLVFSRRSGEPLTRGVPGFFSYSYYHEKFLPNSRKITNNLFEEENWILNLPENPMRKLDSQPNSLIGEKVIRLYLQEYVQVWDKFIKDVQLKNTTNLQESIQIARILSDSVSPLPILLQAIVKEVSLVKKDKSNDGDSVITKTINKAMDTKQYLEQLLIDQKTSPVVSVSALENIVDDHFKGIRSQINFTDSSQPVPFDSTLALIKEIYHFLTATEDALNRESIAPSSEEIISRIRAEANQLPELLRSMLNTLLTNGINQSFQKKRESMDLSLKANITDLCRNAISGRYPFTKGGKRDVTHNDFTRLFSPGGLIDDFFKKNLAQYINTSIQPWDFRNIGDANLRVTSKDLQQFYYASIIRDVFFLDSGRSLNLKMIFKPIDMDASITQFNLDVDGQKIKYAHGPQIPTPVQWPGPNGSSQIRLQISLTNAEDSSGRVFEGPWALFRMLDEMQVTPTQSDKFLVTFNIGGKKALFEVTSNSVQNPFRLQALEQFECPDKL